MQEVIPKIIHYCWFGKKKKPKVIQKCIESWKSILDDYQIIEWNEDNFDISCNDFVREAYENGKFAFVSDYVRIYALYNYGGIYMDTDVQVYKYFDMEILKNDSFWGFEEKNYIATSTIGAKKGNILIKKFLESYDDKKFIKKNGEFDTLTNVAIVTDIIRKLGVNLDNSYQEIKHIATIYPQEYFSPYDYINCYSKKTDNTYTEHHFYKSWLPFKERIKSNCKKIIAKVIGGDKIVKVREIINRG